MEESGAIPGSRSRPHLDRRSLGRHTPTSCTGCRISRSPSHSRRKARSSPAWCSIRSGTRPSGPRKAPAPSATDRRMRVSGRKQLTEDPCSSPAFPSSAMATAPSSGASSIAAHAGDRRRAPPRLGGPRPRPMWPPAAAKGYWEEEISIWDIAGRHPSGQGIGRLCHRPSGRPDHAAIRVDPCHQQHLSRPAPGPARQRLTQLRRSRVGRPMGWKNPKPNPQLHQGVDAAATSLWFFKGMRYSFGRLR